MAGTPPPSLLRRLPSYISRQDSAYSSVVDSRRNVHTHALLHALPYGTCSLRNNSHFLQKEKSFGGIRTHAVDLVVHTYRRSHQVETTTPPGRPEIIMNTKFSYRIPRWAGIEELLYHVDIESKTVLFPPGVTPDNTEDIHPPGRFSDNRGGWVGVSSHTTDMALGRSRRDLSMCRRIARRFLLFLFFCFLRPSTIVEKISSVEKSLEGVWWCVLAGVLYVGWLAYFSRHRLIVSSRGFQS